MPEAKPISRKEALTQIESEGSRISVSAEVFGVYNKRSSFNPQTFPKSEDTWAKLRQRLASHWMFKALQSEDMEMLVDAMKEESFTPGTVVITEGERGENLYIVDEGSFEWVKKNSDGPDTPLKTYTEGEMFGELALIYGWARTATILCNEPCKAFSLDRQTFNHLISGNTIERNERYLEMLSSVQILKTLDNYEKSRILDVCEHVTFNDGELVIKEGEAGDDFYILLKGDAVATKTIEGFEEDQVVKEYSSGDYFGERALIKNTVRAANIIAKGEMKCLKLSRQDFKKLLGSIEHILKRNMKIYISYLN